VGHFDFGRRSGAGHADHGGGVHEPAARAGAHCRHMRRGRRIHFISLVGQRRVTRMDDGVVLDAIGGPMTEVVNPANFTNLGAGIGQFVWSPDVHGGAIEPPYQVTLCAPRTTAAKCS